MQHPSVHGSSRRRTSALAGILLAGLLVLVGCPAQDADSADLPPPEQAVIPPAPDYAEPTSWLARPEDPDRFAVDVIWVYPTVLFDKSGWLMDITRPDLVAGAELSVSTEARVFSGQANVYAPLYRQMNLSGFGLTETQRDKLVAYGEDDVRRALQYYFEHDNKGRPFILAAHSQGSLALTELVLHHWGKIGVERQLVAGYLLGWSITTGDLASNPAVTLCFAPHQTGCFVTYNSVAPGRQAEAPTILPGAQLVNPLTWTRGTAPAPASLNLGSTFFDLGGTSKTLPGFASAEIVDGGLAVVAEDPSLLKQDFFPPGVYHSFDYSLFFENLRANVAQRIQAHLDRP
ncbi:DUF3089 domain-containing protein [Aureimonas glaciei]|uniref:DUF3089 domain-containing protein n=1 Tax=Aureimonas glaciei TaxID=1776957 RepID=A0A916XYC3_9HYPH|nr:DUF3089 domain-containing protein [Aureimonas glaciei]GGD19364.1 hypothetical protein GCM10011335_22840 [Aureimonas glaciei]